ncbi:hypothetical protein SCHPADRAFT_937427 [Schizopora paradoxa]|uniref:Uncharacterized protein n=1 Tax=Schizopora paradoxa TaxID=27342 RepID=A0A0H2RZM8_9AGAM|nr:hypothetical protein SCHPADRAFT_937427 [Schizopora paradoxa]
MPRASGSAVKVHFIEPQNFTFLHDLKKWSCNICTNKQSARSSAFTAKAAMKHERGWPHINSVETAKEHLERKPQPQLQAWLQVPDYDDLFERRGQEQMQRVDSLREFIPFWIEQVEAANRGEKELRLEAFLDTLYAGKANDPWSADWEAPAPAWAVDTGQDNSPWDAGASAWAVEAAEVDPSSDTAHGVQREGSEHEEEDSSVSSAEDASDQDAFMFVEKVARMESISEDRKRNLYDFYKCPTHVKITRIQELIIALKGKGVEGN